MEHFRLRRDPNSGDYLEVNQSGSDLLHNPIINKGTAFTEDERREFTLNGLLPPHVSTLQEQLDRTYENYLHKNDNIERYINLRALQDRNETLFFALVSQHVEEMVPIIYTPTVGEAVQKGSHIYQRARGLYISPENIEHMGGMFASLGMGDVDVIVVTDSQGILGIGDQGVGGMGIPVGKLSLYTVGAGINPANCLPICLDVGTDNEELLHDPLYLGGRHKRYTGDAYDSFVDKFVETVTKYFPNALLQWEDFSKQNAFTNLDRHCQEILCFNDDIQGTGAVTLAGILAGLRIKNEALSEQKFLIYGAGAGGIGISRQIKSALISEGLSEKEALATIYCVDSGGLITSDRKKLEAYKKEFIVDIEEVAGWKSLDRNQISLDDVISNAAITVLLGTSGQAQTFTESIVQTMASNCELPLIFPLSNPTSQSEAVPEDIYRWADGNAIVATGSPFANVRHKQSEYRIGQCNNVFVFPGVGLGALASKAKVVTDEMFTAAAYRLAELLPEDALKSHCVYPEVTELREVGKQIALAVYTCAQKQSIAQVSDSIDPLKEIETRMWAPEYIPYKKTENKFNI